MPVHRLAIIEGDGVGPEVMDVALSALDALEHRLGLRIETKAAPAGDRCLSETGSALPGKSVKIIEGSHACLKGPVGESAADVIVRLRRDLDLYANVRPAKALPGVDCIAPGADFVIVRENTEDLYRGTEFDVPGGVVAMRLITAKASRRIAEYAFDLARARKKGGSVVAVHKSNVLRKSDGLFAKSCRAVSRRHRGISFSEMYVDAAAMNLIRSPDNFDVLVTTNLYGDILSDEAAQLVGGLGLMPSANIGHRYALFEPVHGSAPDIAGRGIANPVAMLLTTSLMLDWLGRFRSDKACIAGADVVRGAVESALKAGIKTPDIGGKNRTDDVKDFVVRHITRRSAK